MGNDTIQISEPVSPNSIIENSYGDQLGYAVAIYRVVTLLSVPEMQIMPRAKYIFIP
jgi:hypothetical protein